MRLQRQAGNGAVGSVLRQIQRAPASGSAPVPPPPPWLTEQRPVDPTAPPAAVSTDDPRTVARLYSPNLVRIFRTQQVLYTYSQSALSALEEREENAKALGLDISEEDKQQKATLTAQVAAAQAGMAQARKDYEMLSNPASTPQQVQEMFSRRGIAVAVVPQTETSGGAALEGSGISAWGLDDKGLTKKTGSATTRTVIGPDGRPVAITDEDTSSTNIGFLTAKQTTATKVTVVEGDRSTAVDKSTTKSIDILKGEASVSKDTTKTATDAAGTTTKTSEKSTYTAGVGGFTATKEDSTQVGSKLDSSSSTLGVTRGPGQLGVTAGDTKKSGTMIGPPGQEKLDKGTEQTNKLTGGLVSDEKGTGIGGGASQDRKTMYGEGKTVGTTVAAGGRCQALVAEVPGSEPPKFTITTTISFDLKLGASAGKEWQAAPGATRDSGLKGNVNVGANVAVGAYASFKRELTEAEAREYVELVRANGRGSKLPEHRILATGASQGWEAAKQLWASLNGSPAVLKSMKPGEQVETNLEVGGDAKAGAGTGGSAPGGTSVGAEVSVKGKHRINVQQVVLPDGKIQITAAIDDEEEHGGALSVGVGAAGAKAGMSRTTGQGRTVVFVLDPGDPAFDSLVATINAAATPEDLGRIATQNKTLVAARTDKTVEGEGTSVGASVGPLAVDLGGKGKLTAEVTRDQQGNVIGEKYTGENQGGGTIGLGDVKVGDSKSQKYVGSVDKAGRATGDLSQTTKSTDLGKSVLGAGSKLANDPLGTIMNPGKLLEDRADTQGTAIADPEIMSVCYAALDKGKWNGKVGGHKHSEWVATGEKIRAACTVRGTGRMAEIVSVDKGAVQRAMAEWTKSDSADRKEALDAIIRPLGGIPGGKAYAFPDGTETMQADWNALVVADPLQGARDKVAAKQPEAALAEMQAVKGKVASLHARLKTASDKFKGMDIQHAEMLGHVNTRMNEINAAIRDLAKTMPAAPAAGATPSVSTVPTLEQVKEEEGRQRAQDAKADLEVYNNNIETMKGYSESVFKKLGQAEARMKDNGLFSDSAIARTVDAARWVKEAEDLLKIWDALYWPTFQLYQKWSPFLALDKARVERLHPAGARGRWQQVYDMTRDKSMAGR